MIEEMQTWWARPLEKVYAAIFIDATMVKIRDGQVRNPGPACPASGGGDAVWLGLRATGVVAADRVAVAGHLSWHRQPGHPELRSDLAD